MSDAAAEQTRTEIDQMVRQVCLRRAALYESLRLYPDDSKQTKEWKADLLLQRLQAWAANPLEFIDEIGWCPDPKNLFGRFSEVGLMKWRDTRRP